MGKSTMDEEKVKSAIFDSDKKKIEDKCDECIKWLDANQMAEKEEYEEKQKEVEQVCNPIIQNLYQGAGGGAPGGMPGGGMPWVVCQVAACLEVVCQVAACLEVVCQVGLELPLRPVVALDQLLRKSTNSEILLSTEQLEIKHISLLKKKK